MLRKILIATAFVLLCLGMVCVRVVLSSRGYLRGGEEVLARGERDLAVLTLGRAARMYAPGNPYAARALSQLMAIGEGAEATGEVEIALLAYREARSAVLSTRSFYTPHPDVLVRANGRLAALMARQESADPELAREPLAARQAWHEKALLRDEMPRTGWTLVALLGAAIFILGAFLSITRGVEEDGRLRRQPLVRMLLLSLGGLLLMLLGLWRA